VNLRLALARAKAVCALLGNKKTRTVGRVNKVNPDGLFRTVEIILSKPKRGGGGGTGPSCEDVDPWPNFVSEDWVLLPEQTMQSYDDGSGFVDPTATPWVYDAWAPGNWGTITAKRTDVELGDWPGDVFSSDCVVDSNVVLEHSPDSGTTWNLFDNSYLATIRPGGSTDTYASFAFGTSPDRFPESYYTESRWHWTVTTEFQTWDYYSYLTDRVRVWIDVDYDAITPAGASNVFVQYYDPDTGSQLTVYVTPGTPLALVVERDSTINIGAPRDAAVTYTMEATEGSTVISNGIDSAAAGFTGWTTVDAKLWQYTVDAESVYNLTSASD
jgi:hypothetical protein